MSFGSIAKTVEGRCVAMYVERRCVAMYGDLVMAAHVLLILLILTASIYAPLSRLYCNIAILLIFFQLVSMECH